MIDQELTYYRNMLRIRRFEETILDQFKRGLFSGTTHTSIGQEANAVGVISQMLPDNVVVTNHRCHGHYLAYGGDMRALFAELMGRSTGICGRRTGYVRTAPPCVTPPARAEGPRRRRARCPRPARRRA